MYVYISGETVIKSEEIIGIFDLDTATVSKKTRDFIYNAEKEKKVVTVNYDLPKSFILCNNKKNDASKIFVSPLSVSTITKRL